MLRKKPLKILLTTLAIVLGFPMTVVPAFPASKEKAIHMFGEGTDGAQPYGSSLILDSAGNLYGTTSIGGTGRCTNQYIEQIGCGTVFELMPGTDGKWTEKILHGFTGDYPGRDGAWPLAGLIFDKSGNLYGTTSYGGYGCGYGCGIVFELVKGANGKWTEKVLHRFHGNDGGGPSGGLVFDSSGNLYGTTAYGGPPNCNSGCGLVFELTPDGNGDWKEKVLHNFGPTGGSAPVGNIIFDAAGNLYGVTQNGGEYTGYCQIDGCGTVFELTPRATGKWREKALHSFCATNCEDGATPYAGLTFDAAGNLYGSTYYGGSGGCFDGFQYGCGVVFRLRPGGYGEWKYDVIKAFSGNYDGANPYANLIFDTAGNLYGTGASGGYRGSGAVFRFTPEENGDWTETVLYGFRVREDGITPYGGVTFDASGNLFGTTAYGGHETNYCGTGGCGVVFEITP
jgi:uncharacterized repeat protein (TIGR03803 family)